MMAKFEILTGADRQRRWSTEQKLSILREAFSGDGSVSDVARQHDILPQQLYAWRKKLSPPGLMPIDGVSFVPVSVAGVSDSMGDGPKKSIARSRSKDIEITLRNGRLLRVAADIDLEVLSSLVACVEAA
ncbi:transposase [Agrobacterium vitis]|nr:transposase [Agrobacterium vitis]